MDKEYTSQNVGNIALYNPQAVVEALMHNEVIFKWLEFIASVYKPPNNAEILLIYPCTTVKPYTKSRSYKALYHTLNRLDGQQKSIHLMTISEPFGLIPEEFYKGIDWNYDCPGLFRWWCRRNREPFSQEKLDEAIYIIAKSVGQFFQRNKEEKYYKRIIAFIRSYSSKLKVNPDHTHRRIIETAKNQFRADVEILPPKHVVREVVNKSGTFAWDMYGVAHPHAQNYLFNKLRGVLNEI